MAVLTCSSPADRWMCLTPPERSGPSAMAMRWSCKRRRHPMPLRQIYWCCRARAARSVRSPTLALSDLQEMQNHMRETIDQGLKELQAKQGKGGLPAAPPSATTAPEEVAFAKDAPPLDPNGSTEI